VSGLIHSDYKPKNILFCRTDSDELKIINFGLSKTIFATGSFVKNYIEISYYNVTPEMLRATTTTKSMISRAMVSFLLCMLAGFSTICWENRLRNTEEGRNL
jgi:serine/threonine protein kinase